MKKLSIIFILFSCITCTYAQIGIKANNSAPITSAQLEVQSTTKAFYPPRMTTQQRTNFPSPPQAGAVVYDTDLSGLYFYNGSAWILVSTLTLPYTSSQNVSNGSNIFSITN